MTRFLAVCTLAVAAQLGAVGISMAQESQQIAFINMEQVFADYYKTQRADARLKEQAEAFNQARKSMVEDLQSREEAFNTAREEAQDQTLSEEARERKRGDAEQQLLGLRELEKELRTFEEGKRKELEEQGRRMRSRIVEEIDVLIEAYAKKQGLFAVVDTSGSSLNQIPVFVYSDESADITAEIVAQLNETEVDDGDAQEEP